MNKPYAWKFSLVLAIVLACVYSIYPPAQKIKLGLDLKGGTSYLLKMEMDQIDSTGQAEALKQAIEILRKRVDKLGLSEPIIQAVGGDRILVQLPGLEEKRRLEARRTIEQTAYLEFRLVHERNDEIQSQALRDPGFRPPLGYTNLTISEVRNGRPESRNYFIKLKPEQGLTGTFLKRAWVDYDQIGRPIISMEFNPEGAKVFGRVTSANVDRQLAIVLDGVLQSAPVIRTAIMDGRAIIEGDFSIAEAKRLASILENPLQAPVKVLEERSVDPSLGRDSIQSGIRAALIGATVVVVFMLGYYFLAGLVANFALLLNLLILIGVLAMFDFTLTLPGIAGIVLTIGMAVDANVLIYERIREELAAGKGLRAAVVAGYQRAFIVIFDSNFTTIMTAIILIWLGSGPVKGFGYTLTIGLLANMFSAVFVTRLLFDWAILKGWLTSIKMLQFFRATKINFLGVYKLAFIASWILIAAGAYTFVKDGGLKVGEGHIYGIDFSGGDSVSLGFAQRIPEDQLRRALEAAKAPDSFIQYQREATGAGEVLNLRLPFGAGDAVVAHLTAQFPNAQLHVLDTQRVGPIVGKELLQQAVWAVIAGMVGIMIYIGFRFGEFSYGLGALVALLHDILMCIGVFCLTGHTFSLPVVAAVLAIIGYSINDTIIVFDRIRETRKLSGGKYHYFDLINRSVNETLPRTVLTASTTLVCALSLYLFGGRVINDFAFTFLIGVITGTYSSIYIASPVVLWFHAHEGKRQPAPAKA
jgi:SecD/SecF fusion protein